MKNHNQRTPIVSSLTKNTVRRGYVIAKSVVLAGSLLFTGCIAVQIGTWKSNNQSAGGISADPVTKSALTSETDIKDALKDLIGDIEIPIDAPVDIKNLKDKSDLGGGKFSPASRPPEVAPPGGTPSTHGLPSPSNITKTSIFIESTKDGPNRTRLPSGRGAVAVLNGQYLGKIESVTVGGAAFNNATDYTKLPNGSREHWRNSTHAQEFHGKIISVKFKDNTTLTDTIDGSGGRLYRDDKLNLK